jgi:hydroxymethylpyrimidine/phosphomethylpyrimidine kinase
VKPEVLRRQLRQASADSADLFVKLGLLSSSGVAVVREWIDEAGPKAVVLDPVLRASDGGGLGSDAGALKTLLSRLTILTPNLEEARALGLDPAGSPEDGGGQFPSAILFKSQPASQGSVSDLLVEEAGKRRFERARVPGPDPRGTGCALSTAITCELAMGRSVESACEAAIHWLDGARSRHRPGPDGRAHLV